MSPNGNGDERSARPRAVGTLDLGLRTRANCGSCKRSVQTEPAGEGSCPTGWRKWGRPDRRGRAGRAGEASKTPRSRSTHRRPCDCYRGRTMTPSYPAGITACPACSRTGPGLPSTWSDQSSEGAFGSARSTAWTLPRHRWATWSFSGQRTCRACSRRDLKRRNRIVLGLLPDEQASISSISHSHP